MKIAILSFYSGMNQRGVERWVYDLSGRLWKNHEITVFQNKPPAKKVNYSIISAEIDFKGERLSGNWLLKHAFVDYQSLKVLQFTIKILKFIIKGDFDVFIPIDGGWEPAIVRLISWLRRKRMIIVGHSGIGCDDANNLWCFPDVFVALSSHAQSWAQKINPFVKTEYIPDGVDTQFFKSDGVKQDLDLKKPIALCVAALESGKRIDLIIKNVSKLKDVSLVVCGKGYLDKEIRTLGKKLLGDRFRLMFVDFNRMPELYRASDILLSATSSRYSFEMVLIEAMSCGLPVVANSDEIRREIVGTAGILADPEKPELYSSTVEKALNSDWGDKPRRQAEKFSWDKVERSYQKLFQNLN